jgi:hypothetical protein
MSKIGLALALVAACAPIEPRPPAPSSAPPPIAPAKPSASVDAPTPPATAAQREPDGNDERAVVSFELGKNLRFEKVGRHYAALHRICDFGVHEGTLLMSHATRPLGFGGATITRWDPRAKTPFSLAFDWNRSGEPEKGGGAGQGFLRLRRFDGRFWAPDADPPYLGFGFAKGMAEGYVFVSDENARFSPVRNPGHLPPRTAVVLPGALHVFDVARYAGRLLVSTGALVPANRAEISPGTLFAESEGAKRWAPVYTYEHPNRAAARLGYMVRFRDRLYVAISALQGGDPNEYVVFAPSVDASHAKVVRVSKLGAQHTLRWYADGGRLYWLSLGGYGSELRVTEDGDDWKLLALPTEAGNATDVLRVGKSLLVMTEQGLYRLDGTSFELLAKVTDAKSPFPIDDAYCSAPLVAFEGALYAGGQRKGELYRLQSD